MEEPISESKCLIVFLSLDLYIGTIFAILADQQTDLYLRIN